MKKSKKLVAAIAIVGIMGTAGTAFAATVMSPAEIASELTGKTVEELNILRSEGTTYGAAANDAGKLDEFQAQMLEQKKIILDQRVSDNLLTQAEADEIYNDIKERQAVCDGTGTGQIGRMNGFGSGNSDNAGLGNGRGMGQGMGQGAGLGLGQGMGQGNCINQ